MCCISNNFFPKINIAKIWSNLLNFDSIIVYLAVKGVSFSYVVYEDLLNES